jgi:hypothetical protein
MTVMSSTYIPYAKVFTDHHRIMYQTNNFGQSTFLGSYIPFYLGILRKFLRQKLIPEYMDT